MSRITIALLGVIAAIIALLYLFDPADHSFYPLCFSYQWFEFQCATCGGLRAFHALLHGRFAEAWQFNPLLLVIIGVSALEGLRTLVWGRRVRWWTILAATTLIAMIVFTVWRNR